MNPVKAGFTGLLIFTGLVACAPSMFDKPLDCGEGCVRANGMRQITYQTKVTGGVVDILFVNDNSGSMSYEQNQIAARFSTFISTLQAQSIDYRIAITTTDISDTYRRDNTEPSNPARAINQNGALQDGNLIKYGNGAYFIDNSTANKETLFSEAIRRQETLQCENFLASYGTSDTVPTAAYQANCPSSDERGIFAAHLTVDKNPAGFIRGGGVHLAIVFLGDEDERSFEYGNMANPGLALNRRLAPADLPQNLIEKVRSRFGGKSLSMHSLIVRPGTLKNSLSASEAADRVAKIVNEDGTLNTANSPASLFNVGDSSCLSAQGAQSNGRFGGSYGYMYALGTRMTNGIEGNICSSNYGSQLQAIGTNLGSRGRDITLACSNPKILELRYVGQAGAPQGTIQENVFKIAESEPVGTEVFLKIECPDL